MKFDLLLSKNEVDTQEFYTFNLQHDKLNFRSANGVVGVTDSARARTYFHYKRRPLH